MTLKCSSTHVAPFRQNSKTQKDTHRQTSQWEEMVAIRTKATTSHLSDKTVRHRNTLTDTLVSGRKWLVLILGRISSIVGLSLRPN